ncbi:MAG: ATP-binding protein [Polaribacter sp.]
MAEKTNVDTIVKKTYIDFGLRSYFLEDLPNLSLSEKKLLKLFKKTKDSFALAKHYHYKALIFKIKVISDSCFYYYNKSKDLSMQLNDSLEVARRYLSMSDIQNNERDYLGSENSVINGLRFIEPLNEVRFTSTFYENLGRVLRITGRSKEARKYYLKYLDTHINSSKKNIDVKYSIFYSQTAKSYEAEFNYLKAREFYKKSIEVDSIAIKNLYRYIVGLEGYSYNNFMLGNKKLALKGYLEVLALRKKENRKKELVYSHSLLGEFYATDKQTKKAVFHTKKALELSKKYNNSERILENLFLLSKLVKGEKGRQYLQEHFILNDSLFKRERSLKNQFAKVRYETEKKDKENANLKEENSRKQLEIESEEQQKIISWLISGASILFIAIGLLVVYNRRKKLLFEAKLEQIEAREKERQQIAKSLHDEVAGDIRVLYKKLTQNNLVEESKELDRVKENVRTLSHQLSSVSFDEVSFKNQIINLISDYFDASFLIKVKDINDVNWIDINNSIKRTLFLSVRESIQNIDKYAAAKNVTLIFNETKKIISLSIIDDGKGFNVDKKKNGIGLKNMKERVEEISGTFSILSALNKGTTIDIEIPKNGR